MQVCGNDANTVCSIITKPPPLGHMLVIDQYSLAGRSLTGRAMQGLTFLISIEVFTLPLVLKVT